MRSRKWLSLSVVLGVASGLICSHCFPWQAAALFGWNTTVLFLLGQIWLQVRGLSASETRNRASSEDPGILLSDALLVVASIFCLIAVGVNLVEASQLHGVQQALRIVLGIASVMLSWVLLHTLFMLHYARMYFRDSEPPIDFSHDSPTYADFAYLAFTVGMTFQVSDTTLRTTELRKEAIRHALIAYLFGTIIVALTINMVAGFLR